MTATPVVEQLASPDSIVPDLLARRARDTPERVAFYSLDAHEAWQPLLWREYAERVQRLTAALRVSGLVRGRRAAILAPTSLEWELAQMACLTLGVSVVGVDVNYPIAQRNEALRSVPIDALFVHDENAVASLPAEVRAKLRLCVAFRPASVALPLGTLPLESLWRNASPARSGELRGDAEPDDDALVVFSSGTTGRPRPVPYTHSQVLLAVKSILDAYPDIAEGARLLCWLPLANLFQRMVNFCAIRRGATSYVIGDPREVMRFVPQANPHLLIGVPRFYEHLYAGIRERVAASPRAMSAVANRALAMAVARARAKRELRKISVVGRGAASVADRLVLRRLRRTFGSNLRYFVSGSAPMPVWLLEWFDGIGLPVFEAYGISENIVPMAMNRPGNSRLGTVGMPLPGQEVRLGADREILVRGPGVFRGYLTASGEVASGRDSADFWATGDYGELDADGFLRVIGRKSEVFKLSNGRWIAPAGIEALLRKVPYVEHAIALGAGRDAVVAFLALDPARFRIRQEALSASARAGDRDEVVRQDVLAATEALPAFQRPAGVLVTTDRFTVEGGELTSNLKLRRMTVETKYATEIGKFFVTLEARRQSARDGITAGTASPTVRWL